MKHTISGNLLSGFLLFAIGGFWVIGANANGRHKGISADRFILKAVCIDKEDNSQTVFRAAIKSGDRETSILQVRNKDGEKDIELSDVSHISFSDNANAQDGFADAYVTLTRTNKPMPMKVKIADKDKAFSVVGNDNNLDRIAVILTTCKAIDFSRISKPPKSESHQGPKY